MKDYTDIFTKKITPFFTTPKIFSIISHPKRSDFLFITNEEGTQLLYHWHEDDSITKITTELTTGVVALHPSKSLAIQKVDQGGSENYQLFLFDFTKKLKITPIISESIGNVSDVYWMDDSNLLVVGFNDKNYYVRKISLQGEMEDIFTTKEQILNTHYNSKIGIIAIAIERRYTKIALINLHNNNSISWVSKEQKVYHSYPAISDSGKIAFVSDRLKTKDEIVIQSIENRSDQQRFEVPGFIGFWPFDAEALQWISEKQILAYVGNNANMLLYLLEIDSGKWIKVTPDDLSFDAAKVTGKGIIWISSSLVQPTKLHRFNRQKDELLIDFKSKSLDLEVENHTYKSYDGKEIQGWLVKNENPNAPIIIFCHGGPTYAITNRWNELLVPLVLAGFNVFAPNFRGSTTFGSKFKDMNIGEIGRGDSKDVLFGAKYISEVLDSKRKPLIFGASHGGFLTLQALTTQPDEWLGGVSLVPVADQFESYKLANSHYKRFLEHFLAGSPEENPDFYKEASPVTHVKNLKAPLFIYHGANDSRCPVSSVKRFYEEAKKMDLPVKLVIAGDEGHGSKDINSWIDVFKLSLEHFWNLV